MCGYRHSLTEYRQARSRASCGQRQGRPTASRCPCTAARRRQSRAKKTSKPTSPSSDITSSLTSPDFRLLTIRDRFLPHLFQLENVLAKALHRLHGRAEGQAYRGVYGPGYARESQPRRSVSLGMALAGVCCLTFAMFSSRPSRLFLRTGDG